MVFPRMGLIKYLLNSVVGEEAGESDRQMVMKLLEHGERYVPCKRMTLGVCLHKQSWPYSGFSPCSHIWAGTRVYYKEGNCPTDMI